jgi:hypothetical protein
MWFCTVTLPYVLTYFCLIGHQQLYMLGWRSLLCFFFWYAICL